MAGRVKKNHKVCVAVFLMDADTLDAKNKTLWDDPKTTDLVELAPPVSPAVNCTLNLTMQYFAIYLGLAIVRSLSQFQPTSRSLKQWETTFQLAKST